MTTSRTAATLDKSKQIPAADQLADIDSGSNSGDSNKMATSTISQPTVQGLVQGASQSRSSDITTSNSVINSSSSGMYG